MTKSGSRFWSAGSIPFIESENLGSIITTASDLAIAIAPDATVLSVSMNEGETGFGNLQHWEGRSLRDFLTDESVEKFDAVLEGRDKGAAPARSIELNHRDNATWEFPIRYNFHAIGQDGAMLMLGRDLRLIAETQQQLVQTQMALERGYEARREFDARYHVLLNNISEAVVFVSVSDGRVRDLNETAGAQLAEPGSSLTGSSFASAFQGQQRLGLIENLVNIAIADQDGKLQLVSKRTQSTIMVQPRIFRIGGERLLFCRLSSPKIEPNSTERMEAVLHELSTETSDAIVITDPKGAIEYVNDAFLDLCGASAQADILNSSLSALLMRGVVDFGVLSDSLNRNKTIRFYTTKIKDTFGREIGVELSGVLLGITGKRFGFILRDLDRADSLRQPRLEGDASGHANVAELVGATPLKDILADTTEVIERICIETAVGLTQNNRVAAAEMLGLSRQSLYVKLRKYNLLSREADDDNSA